MRVFIFSVVFTFLFSFPTNSRSDAYKGWKLGVQMWTFHDVSFLEGLDKADSAKLDYIEAFPGQPIGSGFKGTVGIEMSSADRTALKALLKKRKISIEAFGVVTPKSKEEWIKYFAFAQEMEIPVLTAEPEKKDLDEVNRLAGEYKIKVAIHDHPKPSAYWHPDSVLAAIYQRPNLGACADIGHWVRNGLQTVDCLKKLEGRVISLHLKDVEEFGKIESPDVLFGMGKCQLKRVITELKRQKFKGLFSMEHEANWGHNVPDLLYNRKFFYNYASSAQYLKDW
jgi:sugar phosphate isomerase/epimerase